MGEECSNEMYILKLKESVNLLSGVVGREQHELELECRINDVIEELGIYFNFKAWRVEKMRTTFIYSYETNTTCSISDGKDFNFELVKFILSCEKGA